MSAATCTRSVCVCACHSSYACDYFNISLSGYVKLENAFLHRQEIVELHPLSFKFQLISSNAFLSLSP